MSDSENDRRDLPGGAEPAGPDGEASGVLASDAEREVVALVLRDAAVAGRLTLEEFDQRVGAAHGARTQGELAALTGDLPAAASAPAPDAPVVSWWAIGSRLSRSGPWELARRMSFRSVFGTIDLDLRSATLPGPEVELRVRNFFGTVTVIVPDEVRAQVEGGGWFASEVIERPNVRHVPGAPLVRIHISGPGGTLYVRHEPRAQPALRMGRGRLALPPD